MFFQVTQFQPAVGQFFGHLAPLLFQDFALPLPVLGLLGQLLLLGVVPAALLSPLVRQRVRLDAGLLHDEDQQDDQRAHRADQHGQEREQRDADLGFA